jgi:hypothetical protein
MHAAQKMERKWIAIDQSTLAVDLLRKRFETHFPDCSYEINVKTATARSEKQPVLAIA